MDCFSSGLWEEDLAETARIPLVAPVFSPMDSGVEDEFALGASPPPNRWEGRVVGFCDEGATVDSGCGSTPHPPSGWDGGVVGFCDDMVGEGEIEVGAKRGPFVLDEEVEQVKKKAKNSNAVRRAGVGV